MKRKFKYTGIIVAVVLIVLVVAAAWLFSIWLAAPIVAGAVVMFGRSKLPRGAQLNNPGNIHEGSKKVYKGQIFPATNNVTSGGERLAKFGTVYAGIAAVMAIMSKHSEGNSIKQMFAKYIFGNRDEALVNSYLLALPYLNDSAMAILSTRDGMITVAKDLIRSESGIQYKERVFEVAYSCYEKGVYV